MQIAPAIPKEYECIITDFFIETVQLLNYNTPFFSKFSLMNFEVKIVTLLSKNYKQLLAPQFELITLMFLKEIL